METFLTDVRDAARRLSDSVHIWQIGNEMNLPGSTNSRSGRAGAALTSKFKDPRAIPAVPARHGQIVLLGRS
jgi:hypothetical protein